jgi:ubiquinone/menaquinone biosynthesis C-methylase UbiE
MLCPPVLWGGLRTARRGFKKAATELRRNFKGKPETDDGTKQVLSVYWDANMANLLNTWGEGTVWNEIQFLLSPMRGRVLDIACGTGKTMTLLSIFDDLEIYGCDISSFLLEKGLQAGIAAERLLVCDATKLAYRDADFDYAYSIGSLEHFTEDGILKFAAESRRVVKHGSFHMLPTSRSGRDEGWIKTFQSFHNNSVSWWVDKFQTAYDQVYVLDSSYEDELSFGKWFVCLKR